jgi:hypothetical protein
MNRCPNPQCLRAASVSYPFCGHCGIAIKHCPTCQAAGKHTTNRANGFYCRRCGHALPDAPRRALINIDLLKNRQAARLHRLLLSERSDSFALASSQAYLWLLTSSNSLRLMENKASQLRQCELATAASFNEQFLAQIQDLQPLVPPLVVQDRVWILGRQQAFSFSIHPHPQRWLRQTVTLPWPAGWQPIFNAEVHITNQSLIIPLQHADGRSLLFTLTPNYWQRSLAHAATATMTPADANLTLAATDLTVTPAATTSLAGSSSAVKSLVSDQTSLLPTTTDAPASAVVNPQAAVTAQTAATTQAASMANIAHPYLESAVAQLSAVPDLLIAPLDLRGQYYWAKAKDKTEGRIYYYHQQQLRLLVGCPPLWFLVRPVIMGHRLYALTTDHRLLEITLQHGQITEQRKLHQLAHGVRLIAVAQSKLAIALQETILLIDIQTGELQGEARDIDATHIFSDLVGNLLVIHRNGQLVVINSQKPLERWFIDDATTDDSRIYDAFIAQDSLYTLSENGEVCRLDFTTNL